MYLLDTNVLSGFRRSAHVDPHLATWAAQVHSSDLFLSAITILEIETGALRLLRRDPVQGSKLRAWIDGYVLPGFEGRILPVDVEVAQRRAALHVPDPKAERDALIGATALVHRLRVVTRNVSDFAPMGVGIVNPWE
jgi:predicted nucleic acid-binding protein